MLGGQVGLADHITVGECARLAAQSGVMHDVPPGVQWMGSPAKPVRAFMRDLVLLGRMGREREAAIEGAREVGETGAIE
jgi:UDP-3-O-[3-hydroxymyristoyl] glucosamine N-acyltransferase